MLDHLPTSTDIQPIAWTHCLEAFAGGKTIEALLKNAAYNVNAAAFDRFDLGAQASGLTRSSLPADRGELLRFSEGGKDRPDGIWVISREGLVEYRYVPRLQGFFSAKDWIRTMSDQGFDPQIQSYRGGFKSCLTYRAQRPSNPDKMYSAAWNVNGVPSQSVNA